MLELRTIRWENLKHAYGSADDIPDLLEQLNSLPDSSGEEEPWFSLWSSLAHQGDVFSASFAAVPFVIQALSTNPQKASFTYFQFPTWVEICRNKNNVPVPEDLKSHYFGALKLLPELAAKAMEHQKDETLIICALSSIASAKGFIELAEVIQELDTETAREFLNWFENR